jgi:DNA polymerase-3 subunit epsilon
MALTLHRPLAFLDLETTGTDVLTDRIVEICVVKVMPDGTRESRNRRLNPTIPIPPGATAVHGIADVDVANEPTFFGISKGLLAFLDGCDFAGYNLASFDLRLLRAEFQRAGKVLEMDGRKIVDAMLIYHHFEKRTLEAAVRFFLNREHANAHRAEADVAATIEILDAMAERYPTLPKTPDEINALIKTDLHVDINGKFRKVDGAIRFTFGNFRGRPVDDVAKTDRSYLEWMLTDGDFAPDTRRVVRAALDRTKPGA